MKTLQPLLALPLLACASASAVTLVNDNFSDNNRDGWYLTGGSGTGVNALTTNNASTGIFTFEAVSQPKHAAVFFSSTTLQVGESIDVSFNFGFNDVVPGTDAARSFVFGLFGGTAYTTDQTNSVQRADHVNWNGYRVASIVDAVTYPSINTATGWEKRTSGLGTAGQQQQVFIGPSGTDIQATAGNNLQLANTPSLDATPHFVSFSISRTDATTVSLTATIRNADSSISATYSTIDSSSAHFTFNALAIGALEGTGGMRGLALDNVLVTHTIPEPSAAAALAGVGALAMVGLRRRRR